MKLDVHLLDDWLNQKARWHLSKCQVYPVGYIAFFYLKNSFNFKHLIKYYQILAKKNYCIKNENLAAFSLFMSPKKFLNIGQWFLLISS